MILNPNTFLILLDDLSDYTYKSIDKAEPLLFKDRVSLKINDIILFQKFIDYGNFQYIEAVNNNCETIFIKWAHLSIKDDTKLDEYFIAL